MTISSEMRTVAERANKHGRRPHENAGGQAPRGTNNAHRNAKSCEPEGPQDLTLRL
jgi:hypothetical protein